MTNSMLYDMLLLAMFIAVVMFNYLYHMSINSRTLNPCEACRRGCSGPQTRPNRVLILPRRIPLQYVGRSPLMSCVTLSLYIILKI